ncbi:MAG: chloramphenicol-sensitive protein RarD [Paraburkholderia sp.]|nr:chloramphenicol-sensitive protein RarD [Paraburkholderia sp.]
MNSHETGRGILLSVAASSLFALMPAYTRLLAPLGGLDIFAWRVVWTVPGVLLLLAVRGRMPQLIELAARVRREPRIALTLPICAALIGTQLWLFMWAPLHGRVLEVSLGYFLLPLSMVLVGRLYYRERLVPLQWLAVACAAFGVAHEFLATHAFSWPTLVVALGYPPYFVIRRTIGADSLVTFATEVLLLLPVAVVLIATSTGARAAFDHPALLAGLLPGLGALSTAALACYLRSSRMLPMALFGILGYVEPVLLLILSITVLGESLSAGEMATYVPIWAAIAITGVHAALLLRTR